MAWPSKALRGTWVAHYATGRGEQAWPILQMEKLRAVWWDMSKAPAVPAGRATPAKYSKLRGIPREDNRTSS